MADRPIGSPAAPPRRPRYEAGQQDALSVVLGVEDRETPTPIEARILGVIRESGEPLSVDEIAARTRLDFVPLSKELVDLSRRGFIAVQGRPGSEIVSLLAQAT
jgi:hypothetical protein